MGGMIAGGQLASVSIGNADFWPELNTTTLRSALRLDASVTDERLIDSAVAAITRVNRSLTEQRNLWQAAGYSRLDEVPSDIVNNTSCLISYYTRAVVCFTGATLAERYRSFDTTNGGETNAEQLTPSIDELRRDGLHAIRDLQGEPHATVELI